MLLKNKPGLSLNVLETGHVGSIEVDPIRISLKQESELSGPGTQIYLRLKNNSMDSIPLLGPGSNRQFSVSKKNFITRGSRDGLEYTALLSLSEKRYSWNWRVLVKNTTGKTLEFDLIYVQELGLKPVHAGWINEYYVSQYIERRILEDPTFGAVVCCRQNMKESTGHPWVMMACDNGAKAASTDGMQFYGTTFRETGVPEALAKETLDGECAGESSIIAIQENPVLLKSGVTFQSNLVAVYLPDHPDATSEADLKDLPDLFDEFQGKTYSPDESKFCTPSSNFFLDAPFLPVENLDEEELIRFFGTERSFIEEKNGQVLSFFDSNNNHVVLKNKETLTDRPHAHILQAKAGLLPNESIVSTTAFASGIFNSHITQGNTNFNVLLSICTSQFNQSKETGQRIFARIDGNYFQFGVPSAFEMGLNHCRWIYKQGGRIFQVRTWTSKTTPQVNTDFKVLSGNAVSLLVTHQFENSIGWQCTNGSSREEFIMTPEKESLMAQKFSRARFRIRIKASEPFSVADSERLFPTRKNGGNELLVLAVPDTSLCCISILGETNDRATFDVFNNTDEQYFADTQLAREAWEMLSSGLSIGGDGAHVAAIREILPWYGMNALIHYLTPYGLEQFGGAAWGTRDVSQGPVDLLLSLEKYEEARKILCIIFSHQNPDGGWPQWWMFDSYHSIRADEAHGDIIYWCMLALSKYIKVTGDLSVLEEELPYYQESGVAEKAPLKEHIDRLTKRIIDSFIPGTYLVPFGGGDWNDSLQPLSADLARRLISSWTVEMNYQAFMEYQLVYERTGEKQQAEKLKKTCERIRSDFNQYLVRDDVVAGYGLVGEDKRISVLLHPGDKRTGIKYSLLPMERGILSGIFTKEQAHHHQDLIEKYLKGPDGARLMDRPITYKGGIQEIFQRAESSTFFGREIGLMYIHEHIRYAESLAITGKAEAFVKALRQANPVGYRDVVSCGDLRQSNCYYSSSDVTFKTRYEANERYSEVISGNMPLKGGWRVYSSGPGIYIGLIVTHLLGLRPEADKMVIDPVVPRSMDGLTASLNFKGQQVSFRYSIKEKGFNPRSVKINGTVVTFVEEDNKYRKGGAVIPMDRFVALLDRPENVVEIVM